jgi:hypothetical protein
MSASIHPLAPASTASLANATAGRDLRLDFFRGLALLMIFIDHVSGNRFAAITLQRMGFADAAEVFVFIAGMAGVYAYRKIFLTKGFVAGVRAVFARISTLYLAHVAMVAGVLMFALAAYFHGTEFNVIRKLGLQPLLDDPFTGMARLPLLAYLPHYLDILPLYVALLAVLPLIILGLRLHVLLPVLVAGGSWAAAGLTGVTLPNLGDEYGWFLNPFAWVLLFALGSTVAQLSIDGLWSRLPRAFVATVTFAAAAYVVFAFLHAAPWRVFPALEPFVAFNLAVEPEKSLLSWHRLLDLLAKAWLAAVLVPRGASFMVTGVGGAISRAGRHSLPVFVTGTFLALLGSVVLFEGEGTAFWQIAVTAGGVLGLLVMAWRLENGRFMDVLGTRRFIGQWPLYRVTVTK